jgi:heat shock protein HtpX
MAVEVVEDRKERNQQTEAGLVRVAAGLTATPAVALAIIAGVATRNVLIALLVLVVVAGAAAWWAWTTVRGFGARVIDRPGSFDLTEADQPRLHNLVEGLCVTNGLAKPALIGVDGPGRNMAAVTIGWGATSTNALIVSVPLLDSLSRIELEGAVAQELSRFLDGSSSLATLVAALRSTPPFATIFASRLDAASIPDEQLLADLTGVRMTRYPPGLASALDTVAAGSTEIGTAEPATAGLWMTDPLPAGTTAERDDATLEVRAATLREL